MRVGLFGGTFNPPHLAHLILAETLREQAGLDRVCWIPTRIPPHKATDTPAHHRLAMTRLATSDHDAFEVLDIELQRDGPSYTVDTLAALQDTEPNATFVLMIGGDSLADFHTWRDPDEIVRRAPLLVYRRPGFVLPSVTVDRYKDRIQVADAPLIELSSAALRARVRDGLSIRYQVPEAVRAYIAAHGLYRTP